MTGGLGLRGKAKDRAVTGGQGLRGKAKDRAVTCSLGPSGLTSSQLNRVTSGRYK